MKLSEVIEGFLFVFVPHLQLATDGILKFCLRGFLGEDQRRTLFQFLDIMSKLCADVQDASKLPNLEEEVNVTLALVERDYPISVQVCLEKLHLQGGDKNNIVVCYQNSAFMKAFINT